MQSEKIEIKEYLADEIKKYEESIEERKKERIRISKNTYLHDYQKSALYNLENDFIDHYTNRIEDIKLVIQDENLNYDVNLLISENNLQLTHIHYILNAYWKLQKFKDAKIDTKSYSSIKRENPDTPDSPSIIREALTEELRFANYSDNNVRAIMKVVIGRASKSARKQDQKTTDGRTAHITQFSSSIE